MEEGLKKMVKYVIRLLVTCLLLSVVFTQVDWTQLKETPLHGGVTYFLIVWSLGFVALWVRSYRFSLIARKLNCVLATYRVFVASVVTVLYGLVLPGLMSTGVKWYILKEQAGKASHVLSSMVYNQTSISVVKVLLVLVAIAFANPIESVALSVACGGVAALSVLMCVLLLSDTTGPKVNGAIRLLLKPLPLRLRNVGQKILDQMEVFQTASMSFHLNQVMLCLATSAISVLIYLFAAKAAGIHVPVMALVWQSSVVFLLGRLPISIANLGVREIALIEFLKAYGAAPSQSLVMSMVLFSGVLVMAFIGVIFQVAWTCRLGKGKATG